MKCLLYIRTGPEILSQHSTHDSYNSALTIGQAVGFGIFYIDTGSRVPSRDTQLGITPDTYIKYKITRDRSKKSKLIEQD